MTKLYLILRIVFCILAVALCAAAVFVFVYLDWWGMACVIGAAVCAALMLLFKRLQADEENKTNPPAPVGDFITGPVHIDDIIEKTGLPAAEALSELTLLQIGGYVRQEPGKRFSLNIIQK